MIYLRDIEYVEVIGGTRMCTSVALSISRTRVRDSQCFCCHDVL